ncbi:hypothetical protein [Eubacterium sp.]|uniref:hypothetical protein n=1 Tax=Eubacterium sp. TaxID=142586 RepID=UPI00399268DA
MKKSFSKTIAVLLAVLMVVCSLPMTVFAAGESRSNVQLQFGTYFASGADTHQTYVDENIAGFGDSGLNTAKLDYNKATGTITEASSGHTYGVGDFFTVSVLLENTSSLAASQVGIKYSDNIVPAAVGVNDEGYEALVEATSVTSPKDGFAPNEAITDQSGNAIYNTASSTVGEISYIDADQKTMWANFAVQDGTDAVNLTAPKTVGVNTFTKTAVLATFGFKIVGDGAVTFSLADSKDVDSAYYVETIANGGKVEEYKTYTQTNYDGSTALDFMNNNENIESTKYTVKFVGADGTVISEAQYAEGATVTVPDLPKAEKISDTQHKTYAWDKEPALTATADATYTAVATTEDHKWNAGEKQNDGSTLYTCTVCGATKSETAHVHSYTWKYNGDAYYKTKNDRKDGTMTGTCSCGDTVTKTVPGTSLLRANSYSLILDNSLTINFKITKANVSSFNNIVVKANTKFGPQQVFESPTKDDGATYQYAIGLPPQYVKDDIELVAYSTYEGVEVWGPTYGRSVLTYVNAQFNNANVTGDNASNKNKAFRTMLVNILNYATAAQKKINYDTANLANAGLTEAQKAWASPDIQSFNNVKNYDAVTIDNPTARFAAGGLKLEDAVVPRMTFALKEGAVDIKDITLEATVGGKTFTYTQADNPEAFQFYRRANGKLGTENRYYFYFTDILANQMSETISFQIKVNGKAVSNVCTYSVESYVNQSYPTANEIDKNLYMTMMKYGTSAVAYGRA